MKTKKSEKRASRKTSTTKADRTALAMAVKSGIRAGRRSNFNPQPDPPGD